MTDSKQRSLVTLVLGAALGCTGVAGCTGTIGDPLNRGGGPTVGPDGTVIPGPGTQPTPPGTSPVPDKPTAPTIPGTIAPPPGGATLPPADPNAAGAMPLRRLTRREYNNTVRDLLDDASKPADGFPADKDSEFGFRRAGLVSSQDFSTLRDAAESLGATAEKNITKVAPCAGGAGAAEETCAKAFITNFGQRAYRRPVAPDEADRLFALYQTGRNTLMLNYAGAIRFVVEGMLQAPEFLYHWEMGQSPATVEGKLVRLNNYEVASRLSYFLWGSMPDQALFDAARANKLGSQADVEAQAQRMLGDPRARETIAAFVEDWMGLDRIVDRPKDAAVYPEFKDDLKAAMINESRAFVANVVFDGDGKLNTLLTATYSFVNQPLAAVYGMTNVTGPDLKQMNLSPAQRSGLLTEPGFLTITGATDGSNPVKRGRKVFERVLCGVLPDPPANVPPAKKASEGGTTRERFAEHSSSICAKACHEAMDPLGFAFENYDGIGKYRSLDNGKSVDATGSVSLDGAVKPFKDARELSQHLANSETVKRCFATQLFRFAMVRNETEADRASIEAATAAFARSGYAIKDALVGLASTRTFRYRTPAPGESLQ